MAIDRNYILNKMKSRTMTPDEFDYESLQAPPLYSLLTPDDIYQLNKLATSIRYAAKPLERMKKMDEILCARGFRKLTGGTNRVVYKFLEDDSFVLKVASDAVGIGDNPREFTNQFIFKPFVTKVFEVSPCGTIGLFERVLPITSREEFLSIASDVYDVLRNWFTGEYVMDDIGSEYFMNYGLRKNFGPVLLDFPYAYKLDGNKLYCNAPSINNPSEKCGGVIDYDDGFNHLRCTKCGTKYRAIELKKAVEENTVIQKGGKSKMKIGYSIGKDVTVINDPSKYMDTSPKLVGRKKGKKAVVGDTFKAVATVKGKVVASNQEVEEAFLVCGAEFCNLFDFTDDHKDNGVKALVLMGEDQRVMQIDPKEDFIKGIFVTNLMGKNFSDLCIIEKAAFKELTEKIDGLESEKTELIANLEAKNTLLNELQEEYDALVSSNEADDAKDEDDDLPYYLDAKGKKRDKKTHRFYKEPEKEESSDLQKEPKFNTRSPLIPEGETSEDIKKEIQDKELVKKIDKLLPDQEGENDVPVGAAPPKPSNNNRSKRYDPSFYQNAGKKNKK